MCLEKKKSLQLDLVVEQADFFAGPEGRHADVRAAVAAEGVAERAISARADFTLDGEVDLGQVVHAQLERLQLRVGVGALSGVFGSELFGQAAGAVLAGAAALADLGNAFRG